MGRRRAQSRIACAAVLSSALCVACQALLDFSSTAASGGAVDGSSDADSTETTDAAAADAFASSDARDTSDVVNDAGPALPDGCARLVALDTFDQIDPRWQVRGAASIDGGEAALTPDLGDQFGAIWMPVNPPARSFHVTLKLRVKTFSSLATADGITVAWLPTSETEAGVGLEGNALGFCGGSIMTGNAAAITTATAYDATPDLAVRAMNAALCNASAASAYPFAELNFVDVRYDDASENAFVSVNDASTSASVQRGDIAWIGFTAGTGQRWARHAIDDVTIDVCR